MYTLSKFYIREATIIIGIDFNAKITLYRLKANIKTIKITHP